MHRCTLFSLLTTVLLFSGCDRPSAPSAPPATPVPAESQSTPETPEQTLPEPADTPAANAPATPATPAAFQVTNLETTFFDGFDKADAAWRSWFPAGAGVAMGHDPETGNEKPGSLRADEVFRGLWIRELPLGGGLYRVSAMVKTDDAGANEVGFWTRPMTGPGEFGQVTTTFSRESLSRIEPGSWTPAELIFPVPMNPVVGGEKMAVHQVNFYPRAVRGSAWCDDFKVERVEIDAPFHSGFVGGQDAWEAYVRPGLEVEGGTERREEGFADSGSLAVRQESGVPGMASGLVIPRSVLSGHSRWTLTAVAKAENGAKPAVGFHQLDAGGNTLQEAMGKELQAADWEPLSITFDLRENADTVRLVLLNMGTGAAIFDNVLLRPAYGNEAPPVTSQFPVRVGVYPSDPVAAISASAPMVALPATQAGAVGIFLWGDKRKNATTVLDVELPNSVRLLTAQEALGARQPAVWETLPGRDSGHTVYRFVNPYDWAGKMIGDHPNYYTNLLLVLEFDAAPGTEDEMRLSVTLDGEQGEERVLNLVVGEPISPVTRSDDFLVGLWSFAWPNILDPGVREKLLATYAAAGFNLAHFRAGSNKFESALPTFQKLGLAPYVCILPAPCAPNAYPPNLATEENRMRLADGKSYNTHMALGLVLNSPEYLAAYKKHIADMLSGLPREGRVFGFLDVEYWGKGGSQMACFHPSTIEAFRAWAKLSAEEKLDAKIILANYGKKWSDFRLWAYAQVIRVARQVAKEIAPNIEIYSYDYPLDPGGREPSYAPGSPMSALRSDPFVDAHLTSTYNREGVGFIEALRQTVPYLRRPVVVMPFVMKEMGLLETKSYNYTQISAREYRFQTVAAAAYGARGIIGYPGQLLDADYRHALRDGVAAIQSCADFYFRGTRDDGAVTLIDPVPMVRHTVHVSGDRRLLTLFNGSNDAVAVPYRVDDQEAKAMIDPRDFVQVDLP